jgi:LmbE family N-acetylglucosaminyl deacetylase
MKGSVQVMEYEAAQPLDANLLVDISSVIEQKRRAIACYASQIEPQNLQECCLGLNRFRAIYIDRQDVKYVEAFSSSR